jgi:hypothetical protein
VIDPAGVYQIALGAGSRYDVVTIELDGRATTGAVFLDGASLPTAADATALTSCEAPGCLLWEPGIGRLRARVHVEDAGPHTLSIAQR